MEQPNQIVIEKHGTVTLFDVKGDVTSASEPSFKKAYGDAAADGSTRILLNFDPAAYINSGGIAVLIQLLAQARGKNQKVGITGLSEHFKKIFKMVGITRFAEIHPSVDEALGKLETS